MLLCRCASAEAQFQLLVGTSQLADATPLAEVADRLVLLAPGKNDCPHN